MNTIHFLRSTSPPVVWCGSRGFTSASSERGNVTCEDCLDRLWARKRHGGFEFHCEGGATLIDIPIRNKFSRA